MPLSHVDPMLTQLLKSRWFVASVALVGIAGLIQATMPGQFDAIVYYGQNRQAIETQAARRTHYDNYFAHRNAHISQRTQVLDELVARQIDLAAATEQLRKLFAEIPDSIQGICRNFPATQERESVSLYALDNVNARLQRAPNRADVMQWLHQEYVALYGRPAQFVLAEVVDPMSGT